MVFFSHNKALNNSNGFSCCHILDSVFLEISVRLVLLKPEWEKQIPKKVEAVKLFWWRYQLEMFSANHKRRYSNNLTDNK